MWKWRCATCRERISTQPISMMRSPSLALSPVVSVSSTTWRVIVLWNPPVSERVSSFVFRMPGVAAHPVPLYLMFGGELVELLPQIDILHVLLVGRAPAPPLPVMDPGGDALLHVERVRIDAHLAAPLQRLERPDHRQELHAVVGRGRLAAPELLLLALVAKHRTPAAGPRIAAARPIGIDLDGLLSHGGGACASAARPAPAPGAAPVPCAMPVLRG